MFGEQRYGNRVPSEREQRVIELVAQGLKNREVADAIGTTEHVVKNYLRIIYDKLGLWNRVELALWYEARRQEVPAHAWSSGKLGAEHSQSQSTRPTPQSSSALSWNWIKTKKALAVRGSFVLPVFLEFFTDSPAIPDCATVEPPEASPAWRRRLAEA
jgi:DNA-binding CsgD family transcriptional regulator